MREAAKTTGEPVGHPRLPAPSRPGPLPPACQEENSWNTRSSESPFS